MSLPATILAGIDTLEPLSTTVQQLVSAANSEDGVSADHIVDAVEHDPAVAATILRTANSAAYAGIARIQDIRTAVVRLGVNNLLDILLGDHLRKLKTQAAAYNLDENGMWLHATACSLAVRAIRQETPALIPAAVVAAVVHDIGKLVIVRRLKPTAHALSERCEGGGASLIDAERDAFGCDHAAVGGAIARKWAFPDAITEAIERHHESPAQSPSSILDAVIVANLVAKTIGAGVGPEGVQLRTDPGSLRRLGLDFLAFCRVCAQTAVWLQDARRTHKIA
jgi:HD-like signal output (HDOD) protein